METNLSAFAEITVRLRAAQLCITYELTHPREDAAKAFRGPGRGSTLSLRWIILGNVWGQTWSTDICCQGWGREELGQVAELYGQEEERTGTSLPSSQSEGSKGAEVGSQYHMRVGLGGGGGGVKGANARWTQFSV